MSSVTLTEGSHASILQELLLALLGYDGDVFVERRGVRVEKGGKSVPEPWSIGLNVSTEMDWITAPDRYLAPCLPSHSAWLQYSSAWRYHRHRTILLCVCREGLNSLVALGFHFKVLQEYVEQETSLLPGQPQSSLIRRAIATGLSGTFFFNGSIYLNCAFYLRTLTICSRLYWHA